MAHNSFSGSTAVVTGGSRGIGAAIGHALALAGARVVLTARDQDALDRQVETITAAGGQASGVVGDTTDPRAVRRTREQAEDTFGPVDLLVVNAGGGGRPSALADLAPETWQHALDLNLTAPYLVLREFVPPMMERGNGAVVAMSSIAGSTVTAASTAYSAAKAGLEMVVRKVAAEAAPHGVRVNAVAPGTVDTGDGRIPAQAQQALAERHPSGRLGTVDDVVAATVFLLGPGAGWVTGHTMELGATSLQ